MTTSDGTPPGGAEANHGEDVDPNEVSGVMLRKSDDGVVVTEVPLGGIVPRAEPQTSRKDLSGDLYVRLEGQIYGPFRPDVMEGLLQSGKLTGLEVASPNLRHWTPLAYHPRIVRGRVRDFDKAHDTLRDLSALPARKYEPTPTLPLAAVVKRPPKGGRKEDAAGTQTNGDDDTPVDALASSPGES